MLKAVEPKFIKAATVAAESAVEEVKAPTPAAPAQEEVSVEAPKEEVTQIAEKAPAKRAAVAKPKKAK